MEQNEPTTWQPLEILFPNPEKNPVSEHTYMLHEMKNLTAVLQGFLQLFTLDASRHRERDSLVLLHEKITQIQQLIDHYATLSAKNRLCPQVWDLSAIAQEAVSLLQGLTLLRHMHMEVSFAPALPVWAESFRLRQLILNLGKNGLEAMESGGMLRIQTRLEGNQPVLWVQDEGKGFPAELLTAPTLPLPSQKPLGNGIGMAFCRKVVAECGARCFWQSNAHGTQIKVIFPPCVAAKEELAPEKTKPAAAGE